MPLTSPEELKQQFDSYLQGKLFGKSPDNLYDPIDYIMQLGGKRMRPLLLLMANDMFGGDINQATPLAYAVELFHNFTLMHDDIMDDAPLRRGKQTVHEKYGQNSAILSGDVMQIYVYECFKHLDDKAYRQVIEVFNRSAIQVCEGQQSDMDFETREDVKLPEYLKMIEYKTAALMAGSLEIGAIAAGANDEQRAQIDTFGRQLGICFQIQDDLLDTYGDPEKFGKTVGGDIMNDKKTYLQLTAIEIAKGETAERLTTLRKADKLSDEEKVNGVRAIYDELNIRELASEAMESYRDKAFETLNAIAIPQERKEFVAAYAEAIYQRNF